MLTQFICIQRVREEKSPKLFAQIIFIAFAQYVHCLLIPVLYAKQIETSGHAITVLNSKALWRIFGCHHKVSVQYFSIIFYSSRLLFFSLLANIFFRLFTLIKTPNIGWQSLHGDFISLQLNTRDLLARAETFIEQIRLVICIYKVIVMT